MQRYLFPLFFLLFSPVFSRLSPKTQLSKNLKEVNHMIQRAARLRMGDAKTPLVDACRKAVQANNTQQLLKLIKFGVTAK